MFDSDIVVLPVFFFGRYFMYITLGFDSDRGVCAFLIFACLCLCWYVFF